MTYPGGKNGAGVYQKIINLMPVHEVYIEPFLGNAAVMRAKRPAALNIGLDLDPAAPGLAWLATLAAKNAAAGSIVNGDGARRPSLNPARQYSADPLARFSEARSLSDRLDTALSTSSETGEAAATSHPASAAGIVWRGECADGVEFLRSYPFTGGELVYCDPPYRMINRSGRRLYAWEWDTDQHRQFLRLVMTLPCRVMVSGYHSQLYADELSGWNSIHFEAMTRGGHTATEWLWFNFPVPTELHDYRYLGEGFRERERIKRKKARWIERLRKMPALERLALLTAIASMSETGEGSSFADS